MYFNIDRVLHHTLTNCDYFLNIHRRDNHLFLFLLRFDYKDILFNYFSKLPLQLRVRLTTMLLTISEKLLQLVNCIEDVVVEDHQCSPSTYDNGVINSDTHSRAYLTTHNYHLCIAVMVSSHLRHPVYISHCS